MSKRMLAVIKVVVKERKLFFPLMRFSDFPDFMARLRQELEKERETINQ